MIENPRTGEQIEFEIRSPQLLVIQTTWTRRGQRALAHVHPEMEETFEVIAGQAAFRIDGEERVAGPGHAPLGLEPDRQPGTAPDHDAARAPVGRIYRAIVCRGRPDQLAEQVLP